MENLFDTSKSVLQKINVNQREFRNVQLFVKRDDLIHSEVSGNKWRKLKYNLLQAKHLKKEGILTFGG
ncbi:MAG TPA: 1-aminocyclopropane-1-carboxylate deaminase/D-cysteine desulfhydrase, partial [Fluviicola sp.]|nr:1-aminocyclopropane-1-carboxylate deaminase/D-cysteine desulfhydrase [Fluviicola sp.]